MQSTTARIGVLVAVVAAAVVLFIVLSGDDENGGETTTTTAETTATTTASQPAGPPVITIRDGKPVGGVQELDHIEDRLVRADDLAERSATG